MTERFDVNKLSIAHSHQTERARVNSIAGHFQELTVFRLINRSLEPETAETGMTRRNRLAADAHFRRDIEDWEFKEQRRLEMLLTCDRLGQDTQHIELP